MARGARALVVAASAAAALSVFATGPASAQSSTPVVAGTWAFTYTVKTSQVDPGLDGHGKRTYYFGDGCTQGSSCDITKTNSAGDVVDQELTSSPDGWGFTSVTPLQCTDNATGEVTTQHGADWTFTISFAPSATVERDGVTYASAISGTYTSLVVVNKSGKANNCTVPPNDLLKAKATGVVSAAPVPIAGPAPSTSPTQLGISPAAGPGAGPATIPGFSLPLSERQHDSAGAVARGDRSIVPASLVTPADAVGASSKRLVQNLLLAALLALLMVFPAQIFNSTYEENHARIDAVLAKLPWRGRARPVVVAVGEEGPPVEPPTTAVPEGNGASTTETVSTDASRGRLGRVGFFALVALAGAVIGGFLDPKFGFDSPSIALVVGIFASVLLAAGLAAFAARTYRRAGHRPSSWVLRAIPSGLLVAALCVAISRAVHFEPGYLYGLVGGAAFAAALDRREEGKAEVAIIGAAVGLSVAAWLVFGLLTSKANAPHPSFVVLAADALLAGLFIGGIEGALFGLIPLRFLPGYRVKGWSWAAWILMAAVVSFAFVDILLRPESGYLGRSTSASVLVTLVLFAAFGVASMLFWLYFRLRPTAKEGEPVALEPAVEPAAPDAPVVAVEAEP